MATIRQTAIIRGATPHDIYDTLMNGEKHGALFGQQTTVSQEVGGEFKVGHDLEGTHLVLTEDKRIVQSWRANNWPQGVYSRATFALSKAPGGTRIAFTQTGVPSKFVKETSSGWKTYYWAPLRQKFAKAR